MDLNHGFLAPAVLDSSGNPIALLPDVPLVTEDLPASTRDGHLRAAITQLLDLAEAHGCRLIVAEDLGFPEMRATGRERYGSRKVVPQGGLWPPYQAVPPPPGGHGLPAGYGRSRGSRCLQLHMGLRALAGAHPQASPGVTVPGQRTEGAGVPESTISPAGTALILDNVARNCEHPVLPSSPTLHRPSSLILGLLQLTKPPDTAIDHSSPAKVFVQMRCVRKDLADNLLEIELHNRYPIAAAPTSLPAPANAPKKASCEAFPSSCSFAMLLSC